MIEYKVTEYQSEKCKVRIRRPILTAEEREARVEDVKKALVRFYKETRGK